MRREFLRLFLPLAALVGTVSSVLVWQGVQAQTERLLTDQRNDAEVAGTSLVQSLAPALRHLHSLTLEAPVRAAIEHPDPASLDDMAAAFVSLLQRNPSYAQARWIDEQGRERVRVDAAPSLPRRVPDAKLQAKNGRYYVRAAMAQPPGAIYVSELDLNVEHEQVERPFRPMLRMAVHVAGADQQSAGVLLINVEGRSLLSTLDFMHAAHDSQRLLLNRRGDFLRGLRSEDEFAFMFGRQYGLPQLAPAVWAQMQRQATGTLLADGGVWAWLTVDPTGGLGPAPTRANGTPWFVLTHQSDAALSAARRQLLLANGGITLLILALIAGLSWRLAREKVQLREARRAAETAARSKSEFLANMSHEIRTPINAVIGLTHLLKRDTQDQQQRERLDKIDRAAKHLLQLLNDVLDLSKIEAGKMALEEIGFSLDTVMKNALDMVAARAREKGLELVLDVDHVRDQLRGDPTRLSQALINLLSNAVKFTEQGWVRLRVERLNEQAQRLLLRFEVTDTGPGIAMEHQAKLFSAFEQADASITRRHGGTGLGLALTRHIAQLMGGDIGLISLPQAGSTFWFTAWLACDGEATQPQAPTSLRASRRALLVDDLQESLEVLRAQLEDLGLQVDAFTRAEDAIERARQELAAGRRYELLVIDWRMEPLDGLQTLTALRQLFGADMPGSLLVTASDEPSLHQRAQQAGFDAMLLKPISASTLHDALLRLWNPQPAPEPKVERQGGALEVRLRAEHGGQRVLLAEDNPINQEVASELLRAAGLQVSLARDGAEAVELARGGDHALILMDMQMPVLDGLAATRALRASGPSGIPIIAMTANAFSEDRAACIAAGMNDHVAKPVNPSALYATLLRWLPSKPATAPSAVPGPDDTASPPPLLQRLAGTNGLDLAAALHNVGKQPAALERVLRRFATAYRDGAPTLAQLATAAERERGRALAHSLRGACSTIGATTLAEALGSFEAALAPPLASVPPALTEHGEDLHRRLSQLVAELNTILA